MRHVEKVCCQGFMHDDMLHVKRTCKFTINGEPYKVKCCLFGHDYANVGKEIYEISKDQEYKNLLLQHGRYLAAEKRTTRGRLGCSNDCIGGRT